jgi:hypothetical protein
LDKGQQDSNQRPMENESTAQLLTGGARVSPARSTAIVMNIAFYAEQSKRDLSRHGEQVGNAEQANSILERTFGPENVP